MKRTLIIALVLTLSLIACTKDKNKTLATLSGIYTETSPVNGRSQLNFISSNQVIKKETGSSTEDVFNYVIIDNKIKMTPTWDASYTAELGIKIISDSKFKIENLYPSIPESPTTFMIFEK
jgi:hypothetical protein